MDMYDLKPDAPKEFRGEFNPIATNVAGVQICEHMPLQAKMWDKLACVRSIVSVDEHSDSLVMTGYSRARQPHRQPSVVRLGRLEAARRGHQRVPPFVSLRGMSRTAPSPASSASPIGRSRRAAPACRTCAWPRGVRRRPARSAQGACSKASTTCAATSTPPARWPAWTRSPPGPSTWSPSGTVRNALDLNKEDAKTRERYKGVEQFLTARRLVEAGVGCVTLSIGGWDTHGQNFTDAQAAAAAGRSGRGQPDSGPARPRHGQGRGDGHVGRVRPHAEDQHERRPRSLVAGHVGPGRRRRPEDGPGRRRQHGPRRTPKDRPYHACRRCSAHCTGPWASIRPRRSSTAAAGRCTSSMTATRSRELL